MLLLLLALAGDPPTESPPEAKAILQSCEMKEQGWVCHYRMPPITLVGEPDVKPPETLPSTPPDVSAPAGTSGKASAAAAPLQTEAEVEEAARRERLIRRCADAGWMSLCLPGERKEARLLKEESERQAALRKRVTGLLADNRCDDAVKAALEGGNLNLAQEARGFCRR